MGTGPAASSLEADRKVSWSTEGEVEGSWDVAWHVLVRDAAAYAYAGCSFAMGIMGCGETRATRSSSCAGICGSFSN